MVLNEIFYFTCYFIDLYVRGILAKGNKKKASLKIKDGNKRLFLTLESKLFH